MRNLVMYSKVVVVLLASIVAAYAEDDNKKKFTNGECLDVAAAMDALSGTFDRVVKGPSGEIVAKVNFKLKGAWASIALNATALSPLLKAYTDFNNKTVNEISESGQIARYLDTEHQDRGETKEWRLYQDRIAEFMARPCNIDLARIKKSEIQISDENPIPLRVYRTIEPILE